MSLKGPQHERLTALSEQCLRDLRTAFPTQCANLPRSDEELEATRWADEKNYYPRGSRWPDDPTRDLGPGALKLLIHVGFSTCETYLKEDEAREDYAGILCHSHFGRLQFLHAMQPTQFSPEQTRPLIGEWTSYAYRVATKRLAVDRDFCQSLPEGSLLRSAFISPSFPHCVDGLEPKWTVQSLFARYCKRPFTSKTCATLSAEEARYSATGALIHLIQDSYSQAHAARGGMFPAGPYAPRIVCEPVVGFYTYDAEQRVHHSDGDRAPTFDRACGTPAAPVLDPVTAVARMLWLIGNDCDEAWATQLVDRGVLGTPGQLHVPRSSTECRAPPV